VAAVVRHKKSKLKSEIWAFSLPLLFDNTTLELNIFSVILHFKYMLKPILFVSSRNHQTWAKDSGDSYIWSPNRVNNPLHQIMQLLFKDHTILNPKLLSAQYGGFKFDSLI